MGDPGAGSRGPASLTYAVPSVASAIMLRHAPKGCFARVDPTARRRAIAQLVEHRSPKPAVGGSSPSCPANRLWALAGHPRQFSETFQTRSAGAECTSVRVHTTLVEDERVADSSGPQGRDVDSEEESAASSTPVEDADELSPDGANLVRTDLAGPPAAVEVSPDELDAEELADPLEDTETPDEADPEDVQIDDEAQLAHATSVAQRAKSSKPVKRNQTVAPVKKSAPTPKRDDANTVARTRTTPVQFTRQSVGELKKVVWPTSTMLRQYFVVVLAFVLFIMFFVAGLDALFGWLLLQWLG